jgi:D-serine deaminase-like pyridoxal phosphate-dependent protein
LATRTPASEEHQRTRIDHAAVARLRDEPLPAGTKGLPLDGAGELTINSIANAGWNVLTGDVPLPVMTLSEGALAGNIETMATYCTGSDVLLAPHGKTTMAPQLFERQIRAGCWALTAATPAHLAVYRSFGIERILYANQLVEASVLGWLVQELNRDPAFDFYCLVDSPQGVARMTSALRDEAPCRPLNVLIEVGHVGGRTGCRTIQEVALVAQAVARSPHLRLAGVEAFEGTLHGIACTVPSRETADCSVVDVPGFLETVTAAVRALTADGGMKGDDEVIVSAGGSAFFDVVVDAFATLQSDLPGARLVLRSGSYVVHDGGYYDRNSPFGRRAPAHSPKLVAAAEVWSVVLSRPEPNLLIVGAGKRDLPIDLGLPSPTRTWSKRRGFWTFPPAATTVCGVSDQHVHIRIDADAPVEVGDLCATTISHPCTAFDKWRLIPVVDDELTVIDGIRTFF